jgi:hypothetical protein
MGARGPKKIQVDWELVDNLCQIQCTGEEIASTLGISYDTIERRCKEDHKEKLADYIKKKAEGGKASLRRMQYKAAEKGNPTMLIWLGKQYLGQSDKQEVNATHTVRPDEIGKAFSAAWADIEDAKG